MKLLLDTQIWLWLALEPERLRPEVAERLSDPKNELWLSPIIVWEVLLLARRAASNSGRTRPGGFARRWRTSPFERLTLTMK